MHFFSPAHVMKLVEVVRSPATSEDIGRRHVVQFAQDLRKIPVVVKECPGFLVNRLLAPYLGEAMLALQEGAATAEEIDEAMVEFGMPMGPFTLLDFMGLDVSLHAGVYMASQYGERFALATDPADAGGCRPAGREERRGLLRLRRPVG